MYGSSDLDIGSMASHSIFRGAFLFQIPSAMSNEDAAPLMCGGATVFNILDMYNIRPTDRVAVLGVGELGHLAIQFAAKWGCEVVVFSRTENKKEEALHLGAKEFYATKGLSELTLSAPIDHLLVTTSAQVPWSLYLPVMAAGWTIYPITVDQGDLKISYMPLLGNGLRIQGSIVAPRAVHRRMLKFANFHGIKPMIQKYKLDREGIETAMADLREGKMRYRGVLYADGN